MIYSNSFFIDYSSCFFYASFVCLVSYVVAMVVVVFVDIVSFSVGLGTSFVSSCAACVVTIIFGTAIVIDGAALAGTSGFSLLLGASIC